MRVLKKAALLLVGALACCALAACAVPSEGQFWDWGHGVGTAAADGWTYQGGESGIYRTRDGFKTLHRIGEAQSHFVTLSGGWLYYAKIEHQEGWDYQTVGLDNSTLWKMKPDGSQDQLVCASPLTGIVAIKNYLYSVDTRRNLYRVKTDGSGQILLCSGVGGFPCFDENWMYFAILDASVEQGRGMYRMRHNGRDLVKLCDEYGLYPVLDSGQLYFVEADNGTLLRVRADGASTVETATVKVSSSFYIVDGYIYYLDETGVLNKSYLAAGGAPEKVFEPPCGRFRISGGVIYASYASADGRELRVSMGLSGENIKFLP